MKRIFSILFVLVLAVSLMLVPAASVGASPGPGIVGLWHLDGDANDSSGFDNHGTLSGGRFGGALSFDGSDDYVEIPSNSSIMPTTLTVEAWVQPGKTGARQSIVSKWDGGADASYSLELTAANKFLFYLHNGTTTKSITGTTVVTVGTWYHVAGTYDGSQARLYVDGNLEAGPTTLVAPMTNSNVPLRIGASAGPAPYSIHSPFQGAIDEVRISDVARASFVLTTPPSADDDTVALWHFNESVGSTACDETANDNDGTIHGASWVPAGPTWTTGMFGQALSFDGTDDYVKVPDSTSLEPSNITVEAWIKRSGDPGNNKYIVSKHYGSGWNSYALRTYSSGLQFYIGTTSTWYGSPMSGPVWDGNWHHVVGTFDGSYVRLYVDGSEVGMGTLVPVGTSIAYDGAGVKFGVPGDPWLSGPYHFGGKIDEVHIWDVALTPDEIAWLPPVTNADFVLQDGTTLPLKFQIFDDDVLVTSPQWVSVEVTGPVGFATKTYMLGDGVENLRWDADEAYYIANLKTKVGDWPPGTYTATVCGIVTDTITFELSADTGVGRGNSGK